MRPKVYQCMLLLFSVVMLVICICYAWKEREKEKEKAMEKDEMKWTQVSGKNTARKILAPEYKTIAITFDDGPGPYTKQLLAGLKERDVKAAFFVIGENAVLHKDILKQMKEEGHLIGNHTFSHVGLDQISEKNLDQEILSVNRLLESVTGEPVRYIRPPYGKRTTKYSCINHMTNVLWNIDPLDWSIQEKERIKEHILSHAKDGGIIILHDIYESSVLAALDTIDELKKEGYHFVRADQMKARKIEGCLVIK